MQVRASPCAPSHIRSHFLVFPSRPHLASPGVPLRSAHEVAYPSAMIRRTMSLTYACDTFTAAPMAVCVTPGDPHRAGRPVRLGFGAHDRELLLRRAPWRRSCARPGVADAGPRCADLEMASSASSLLPAGGRAVTVGAL